MIVAELDDRTHGCTHEARKGDVFSPPPLTAIATSAPVGGALAA